MGKLIIGYIIIFGLYFSIKGCNYSYLEKTKGVVVDSRSFSYGRATGHRADIPYPIARFKGPPVVVKERHDITQAEVDMIDLEINKMGSITEEMAKGLKAYKVDSVRQAHPEITKTITEYTTVTPWGAFFFSGYHNGDSVDVVYEPGHTKEARVCTFFSYWLTLPSLCIVIFLCLLWTGIARISEMQG